MKVFLTGATGFVGSALLQRFVADGVAVRALVRNDLVKLPYGVGKVVADLAGLVDCHVSLATSLKECGVVVHAAARSHIMRDEVSDPLAEYRRVNRDATLALGRLAAQAGVKRFVFVSSVKVNGEMTRPRDAFVSEITHAPIDPYGLSKYEAEQGLLAIAKETGLEVVIIRPPLVYGPGAKGNFATMVNWVKKGVPLPFGSVRNARSLVALNNLVDFIVLCADPARSPKAANEVFLISDGADVSTSDLLRKVAKACGVKSRLLSVPTELMRFAARVLGKGAVADRLFSNLQVDSSKAQDLLGWKPVVTMDEALSQMFNA